MRHFLRCLALVLGLATAGCQAQNASTGVVNMDVGVEDFAAGLSNSNEVLLLDVRTDKEFMEGHLIGATQLDFFRDDFKTEVEKLDRTRPVYVYCRSGNRSGKAAKLMKELGFAEVYNLEGGFGAWLSAGKAIAK